jgi:hypothetical protein
MTSPAPKIVVGVDAVSKRNSSQIRTRIVIVAVRNGGAQVFRVPNAPSSNPRHPTAAATARRPSGRAT